MLSVVVVRELCRLLISVTSLVERRFEVRMLNSCGTGA